VVRYRSPGCIDVPLNSVERSDIGTRTKELGHERWIPDHTPIISKGSLDHEAHVCRVDDAFRRNTKCRATGKI